VLEEVNEMLAARAEERKLSLVLEYATGLPRHFIGDASRIRQIMTNLVGNAVKFTSRGHVLITVQCMEQVSDFANLRVAVEDTGVGIAPDKIGLLFQKFSQVDGSPARRYGGTGLGLAITLQLVELMGGTIGVESRLGEGSTFWFTLPLCTGAEASVSPVDATELRDLRVMIVDDCEVNRRVLHEQITAWGMRNGSFSSGEDALAALLEAQRTGDGYQFVILDYQMPEMDGAQVAMAIKSCVQLCNVVVIMLTSVGHWNEVRGLEGSFIDGCLVKPVRQSQLLNTLAAAWAKKLNSVGLGEAPQAAPPKSVMAKPFEAAAIRVLLAEDNRVNQTVSARMLERLGFRAEVASNGRMAVEMWNATPYEVILMDCQMPDMDGYAAAGEIRRQEGSKRTTAIIALTAEAMPGTRERCLAAGMDDYLVKPIKLEELRDSLQRWSRAIREPQADAKVLA
jgi:CheY-like chemotaxis protein